MLNCFINKGHMLFDDIDLLNTFDIDNLHWGEKGTEGVALAVRDENINQELQILRNKVSEKYLKSNLGSHTFANIEVVNGLDMPTMQWHNDLIEGPNCGCLLYYDDTDKDTGGSISFRFKESKEVIEHFYPKKGNILFINHSLRFEHCVEPQKMPVPRRVISLNFNIDMGLTK